MSCDKQKTNAAKCNCTYAGCPRHGKCCECLGYHLGNQELPACAFPNDVEKSYDRSFSRFVQVCKESYGIKA